MKESFMSLHQSIQILFSDVMHLLFFIYRIDYVLVSVENESNHLVDIKKQMSNKNNKCAEKTFL